MKPYSRYKDSGVEWLGEVPEHWDVVKLKYLIKNLESGVSVNATDSPASEENFGILKTSCVYGCKFNPEENKIILPEELSRAKVNPRKGEIIISRMNTPDLVGSSGYINYDYKKLFLPDRLWQTIFHDSTDIDSYWLSFIFCSEKFRNILSVISTGTSPSMKNLSQESFLEIKIPFPDRFYQTAIATFLDRKTAEIDRLISNKERLIDLYEEEKAAIINHAVTKGLNPDAKMKDSGIEWLGEIPEHWEMRRLKYIIASVTGGGTPQTENEEFWNGNIPWVSPKDMKKIHIYETEDYVTEKAVESSSTNLIPPERLLIVVRSGILKHSLPIAINKVAVCLNQDIKAINPFQFIKLNFLFWKLKGTAGYILAQCNQMGATVDSIEVPELMNFTITYPKHSEQTAIAQHIETKCGHIDAIISKLKRQVELLKEYRTALISEAVTGKIDLREWQEKN